MRIWPGHDRPAGTCRSVRAARRRARPSRCGVPGALWLKCSLLQNEPGEIAALQFDPVGSTRRQCCIVVRNLHPNCNQLRRAGDARRVVPNDARVYSACCHGLARPSAA